MVVFDDAGAFALAETEAAGADGGGGGDGPISANPAKPRAFPFDDSSLLIVFSNEADAAALSVLRT